MDMMQAMKRMGAVVLAAALLLSVPVVPTLAAEAPSALTQPTETTPEAPLTEELPENMPEVSEPPPIEEPPESMPEALPPPEVAESMPEALPPPEVAESAPTEEPQENTPEAVPAVELLLEEHVVYINGSNDLFRPNEGLKRSETAKIIHSLLKNPAEPGGSGFVDVPEGKWFSTPIGSLAAMGILMGYGDTFLPNKVITRAEFVTVLSRLFSPIEAQCNFIDVPKNHWAYGAIAMGAQLGWVAGDPGGTFRPADPLKRGEAVTIINRLLGRKADEEKINASGKIFQFLDLSFNHWAYYQVMEAAVPHTYEMDSAFGREDWLSFSPNPVSRAQGYHLLGGELYYVNGKNQYEHDSQIGVLTFDSQGRYTSGMPELDQRLTNIARSQTDPSASRRDNLYRIYQFVMGRSRYQPRPFVGEGTSGWEPQWALKMIDEGRGNCYSYSAMFTMLARKLGFQAKGISGQVSAGDFWGWEWWPHAWVEIQEGGETVICDPQLEGVYCRDNGINWDLFMKNYRSLPTIYTVNGNTKS